MSHPVGSNYVFPKEGACAEGTPLPPSTMRHAHLPEEAGKGKGTEAGTVGGEATRAAEAEACTWSRHPTSRVFWGTDLVTFDWDFSWVQDTPTDMNHTLDNIKRFADMVQSAPPPARSTMDGPNGRKAAAAAAAVPTSTPARFMRRRCCGC